MNQWFHITNIRILYSSNTRIYLHSLMNIHTKQSIIMQILEVPQCEMIFNYLYVVTTWNGTFTVTRNLTIQVKKIRNIVKILHVVHSSSIAITDRKRSIYDALWSQKDDKQTIAYKSGVQLQCITSTHVHQKEVKEGFKFFSDNTSVVLHTKPSLNSNCASHSYCYQYH